jgi:mannose-6-phosphate isomerase-like protein (cupin superfamily)
MEASGLVAGGVRDRAVKLEEAVLRMRIERARYSVDKGWYLGPWNSQLDLAIGCAHAGIDEPHLHTQVHEVYLVARGSCSVRVEQETVYLKAGDVLIVEPGEAHTFLDYSNDYFHFVIHTPALSGEQARAEKRAVDRAGLGL